MRQHIILLTILAFLVSCETANEPTIFEGQSNVIITDGTILDTLARCYCWRTNDTLGITIVPELSFSGLAIDISNRNGRFRPSVHYFSDYDQFDGQSKLNVKLNMDYLKLGFEHLDDSVTVSGQVELESFSVNYFKDDRKITASGAFNCKMDK